MWHIDAGGPLVRVNAGRACNSPVQRSASPMRTLQECERNCPTPKIAQPCKHIPGHAKERFNIGYPICPYGAQYLAIAIGVFVGFADRTNDFTLVVTDHFICIWDKKTEHSMGLASKEFPLLHRSFQREDMDRWIGGSHRWIPKCRFPPDHPLHPLLHALLVVHPPREKRRQSPNASFQTDRNNRFEIKPSV